jgi:kinesin family protein 5
MYEGAAKPLINVLMSGFNVTVFAYGQTSSGKTFTMQGPDFHHPELKGITPRLIDEVFETMANDSTATEYSVKISIVEIYMERIRDLLDITKTNLKIRESAANGIYIDDVTEVYTSCADEVFENMDAAYANRAVGHTNMNEGSSRSHLIFLLHLYQKDPHNHSVRN